MKKLALAVPIALIMTTLGTGVGSAWTTTENEYLDLLTTGNAPVDARAHHTEKFWINLGRIVCREYRSGKDLTAVLNSVQRAGKISEDQAINVEVSATWRGSLCPGADEAPTAPTTTTAVPRPVAPVAAVPARPATAGRTYASCAAARAAGAAPLYRGQPGYSSKLDGDGDGIACEKPRR